MQNEEKFLYSQPVLDFVTVATEYCKYVEQCSQTETNDFCRVMRGLLPMIYLKATLLEEVPETAGWNEKRVTEEDYNYIRSQVAAILGSNDDFLDVFVEDFKYSEHPVLCTISENLTDIYQQLRELVEAFSRRLRGCHGGSLVRNHRRISHSMGTKTPKCLTRLTRHRL